MEGPARTRLVALVVLLVLAVPLTIVAIAGSGGGGSGSDEPEMRAERSPEVFEVVVYVESEVNVVDRTRGRRTVSVECVGDGGEVIASEEETWPFTDTDQNTLDPHAHVRVNPARIEDVSSCRIRTAEPALEAPVT